MTGCFFRFGFWVAMLAATLAAPGCNRAVNTMVGSDGGMQSKLIVGNPGLQNSLTLTDYATRRVNDMMQASVVLQSRVKRPLRIEYAFKWFDADGFEIPDVAQHWTPLIMEGMEYRAHIQATAPNLEAMTFKILVREPQPVRP